MKIDDRVRFTKDITTWNGKARRAKVGDQGRVIWVFNNAAVVRVDGKAHVVRDVPVSSLEVIQ